MVSCMLVRGVMVIVRAITNLRRGLASDMVLHPLHELGCEGSEARMGVSYSIYKLENYSKVSTVYIVGAIPALHREMLVSSSPVVV